MALLGIRHGVRSRFKLPSRNEGATRTLQARVRAHSGTGQASIRRRPVIRSPSTRLRRLVWTGGGRGVKQWRRLGRCAVSFSFFLIFYLPDFFFLFLAVCLSFPVADLVCRGTANGAAGMDAGFTSRVCNRRRSAFLAIIRFPSHLAQRLGCSQMKFPHHPCNTTHTHTHTHTHSRAVSVAPLTSRAALMSSPHLRHVAYHCTMRHSHFWGFNCPRIPQLTPLVSGVCRCEQWGGFRCLL